MAGYFSFRKTITGYFVKTIYALGFIVLTVGGIGLAAWAGLRLNEHTIPTRNGIYLIAAGAGALLVGNLVWRMICEFWLLLFNVHGLLVSIEGQVRHESVQTRIEEPQGIEGKTKHETVRLERFDIGGGRSVLGLS
jgi:hypothetical protein